MFRVKPAGAQVWVDGVRQPTYQKGVSLSVGRHRVLIKAKGHDSATREVQIYSSDATLLRVVLKAKPVSVVIRSSPPGASLKLGDVSLGQTPYQGQRRPGWVRVSLQKAGFIAVQSDWQIHHSQANTLHLLLGGWSKVFAPNTPRATSMSWVPAGYFTRGAKERDIKAALGLCRASGKTCRPSWFSAEQPARQIWLRAFWIDVSEVSLKQFRACVRAGVCQKPRFRQKEPTLPVVGVTWSQARRFCRWRGGRLPTEAEWEKAARGPDREGLRRFPWGAKWEQKKANHGAFLKDSGSSGADKSDGFAFAAPVTSFGKGRSPFRLLHMAGNVAEWVQDCFYTSYYRRSPERMPVHLPEDDCLSRVVRGGSWMQPPWELRVTSRLPLPEKTQSLTVGFRCARDPQPTKQTLTKIRRLR